MRAGSNIRAAILESVCDLMRVVGNEKLDRDGPTESVIGSVPMLPTGWTIECVRATARCPAELVSTETLVAVDEIERVSEQLRVVGTTGIEPRCILEFSGLYLVQDTSDGCWYMGQMRPDGVIHCWAGYGDDLAEAIESL